MEHLLRLLPRRPQSIAVRYGITTLIVGLCVLILVGLHGAGGLYGFFLLYPAIFLASVLFDRGSGLYATGISTLLLYYVLTPAGSFAPPDEYLLLLVIFVLIAMGLATISEGLRKAWERAVAAERTKDLLLRELGHRTKNNLTMAISVLTLQARSHRNPEVKDALKDAVSRIQAIAGAHDHFEPMNHDGRIDMHDYLEKLCGHLGENLRDIRPIAVTVDAEKADLRAEQAIPLGQIANELVTNALKHAFPDDRAGTVRVTFRAGPPLVLAVEDDGIGHASPKQDGMGSRLVRLLVQQLAGAIEWEDRQPGCRVRITVASQADRSAA